MAVTFACSAAAKVAGRAAYADFRGWLTSAAGVPRRLSAPAAAVTVALEAATAAAMLVPALVPAGFGAAAILLVVFSAGVRSMMRRRVAVPCRCFGAGTRPPGPAHLVRNGLLLLVAFSGLLITRGGAAPPPLTADSVLAAVAGTAAALLLVNLDELVDLYRPLDRP
ncbi:MauE/DoxX family redox-associated membrane protein [Spirillospora sp. CA-294931]|uniref:MauE/DoxX family redox-associated membrane protein n=1 Tax=Spirillospora sp. CA-294931 TaxID=3240042 RepID=UPI003D91D239